MKTRKTRNWEDVKAARNLSPEKRAELDARIAQEVQDMMDKEAVAEGEAAVLSEHEMDIQVIKEMDQDDFDREMQKTPDEIRAEVGSTKEEFTDEEIAQCKELARRWRGM